MLNPWRAKTQGRRVAVVSGARTPFAKAGTKLKKCSAVHLGVTALEEAIARIDLAPDEIDEVVFGNAGTPADAANIARVIALRAGVPEAVPAYSVHRNCASAMEAIAQGCMKISLGVADVMAVGGTESMSNMPLIFGDEMTELFSTLSFAKTPAEKLQRIAEFRPAWLKPVVSIMEGLTDPISGLNMGQTAEVLARDFGISREEQDRFAMESHRRTVEAQKEGRFKDEVVPVLIEPEYEAHLATDVGPREGQSMEMLGKLKPFFDRENGTVTPGNACPITDGAAALILMSEGRAKAAGLKPLGMIESFTFAGCDPKRMGLGPVYSSARVLSEMKLTLSDFDLVELNEAFAVQVLACARAMGSKTYCTEKLGLSKELGELDLKKTNVNGGAIALGHPVGATGARILFTLLLEMQRRDSQRGLATLCIGGGQGAAFVLERS